MTEAAFTMPRRPVMSAHGLFHSVPMHREHNVMLSMVQVVDCWEGVPVPVLAGPRQRHTFPCAFPCHRASRHGCRHSVPVPVPSHCRAHLHQALPPYGTSNDSGPMGCDQHATSCYKCVTAVITGNRRLRRLLRNRGYGYAPPGHNRGCGWQPVGYRSCMH